MFFATLSSLSMKGLSNFVSDIRAAQSAEEEEKRVQKELAKICLKFNQAKHKLSSYDRKKYLWKLVYAHMLGYSVDTGHMQIVECISSNKFSEKFTGYIACNILLRNKVDVLRLCVNTIKIDICCIMNSINTNLHANLLIAEHVCALSLNFIANTATPEIKENVFTDIQRIINPMYSHKAFLRKKAYLCLLKLYRLDSQIIDVEVWHNRILQVLEYERDIGCLLCLSSLIISIFETQMHIPELSTSWVSLRKNVVDCMNRVINNVDFTSPDYVYYSINAPWLQIKLLRILQYFPPTNDLKMLTSLNEIIYRILSRNHAQRTTDAQCAKRKNQTEQERVNRSNIEHALLFEAINLGIHLENSLDLNAKKIVAALLGTFIHSKEANIRYLGLECMSRMAYDDVIVSSLRKHVNTILTQLAEADISIRKQALNLLYALCNKDNWSYIVDELLETLRSADFLLQEEIVLKIAILVERNAPDYTWYVDVVFKMIEYASDCVYDDVVHRVIQVLTGFDNDINNTKLQTYAARKAYDYLSNNYAEETMIRLGSYILGEFGHVISKEISGEKQLRVISKHFTRVSNSTRALMLIAYAKIGNAHPQMLDIIIDMLEDCQDSQNLEVQTRACELSKLLKKDDALIERSLAIMPSYSESIYNTNPLIKRMKNCNKSRAHTRLQLEEVAKTEGYLLKPNSVKTSNQEKQEDKVVRKKETNKDEDERQDKALKVEKDNEKKSAAYDSSASSDESERNTDNDEDTSKDVQTESDSSSENSANSSSSLSHASSSFASSEEKSEDEEQKESKEIKEKAKSKNRFNFLSNAATLDIKTLWKNLCITNQGLLYQSPALSIYVKNQYDNYKGEIFFKYVNNSDKVSIDVMSVTLQLQGAGLAVSKNFPISFFLNEKYASYVHAIQVECVRPFLNSPKYIVNASIKTQEEAPQFLVLPFNIPCIITKFMMKSEITAKMFEKFWTEISTNPTKVYHADGKVHETFKNINKKALKHFLANAFTSHVFLIGSHICGAGTVHTSSPHPTQPKKNICIACMYKILLNEQSCYMQISTAAAHSDLSKILCQILSAYLLQAENENK